MLRVAHTDALKDLLTDCGLATGRATCDANKNRLVVLLAGHELVNVGDGPKCLLVWRRLGRAGLTLF